MIDNNKPYPIIGLEVHVQLKTKTKAFCRCENKYGGIPNTRVCPVCLGLPGPLPVLNREVLRSGVLAGLAFNSRIASVTKFDRKNYAYPDLTKGYQISQYDVPICSGGEVTIQNDDKTTKNIRLTRIHMEEDAGKLIHLEDGTGNSYVDYNRCGAPLLEIVSEPDITDPEEAVKYLNAIKEIFIYLGLSDCNMEEGSLRCDANISMMIPDSNGKMVNTPISEIKNMNSFKNVKKAIEYEMIRQVEEYKKTGETNNGKNKITRGWDDVKEITVFQRTKEGESDYRYFPEPDLPYFHVTPEFINEEKKRLVELPLVRRSRLESQYEITPYDANLLTANIKLADYFEDVCRSTKLYKKTANLILSDINAVLKTKEIGIEDFSIKPERLAGLVELIGKGRLSSFLAKQVFEKMLETDLSAETIAKDGNLIQSDDTDELLSIVIKVLQENGQSISDYKSGKDNALKFLMGQVMKQSKGKANPVKATELILKQIEASST